MKLAPMMSEERGLSFGPEIFGSCRSEVDGSNGVVSFQKEWADLHSFEGLGRGLSRDFGGAWRCV